jgi:hypothetical protein
MSKRLEVVLDKSYLQSASKAAIHDLCRSFRVIMPGALFFELLTTSELDERRRAFAKIPTGVNPVEIVEHVGKLMRFEIRNGKPSPSLYERRNRWLFEFNEKLATGTFQPTQQHLLGISSWQKQIEEQVDVLRKTVATTHLSFPEISNASPRKDKLDGRWAFFRWMQVDLLASLDHVVRYGVGSDLSNARDLDNEVADLQYRIMGALAGGIATEDKKSKEVFRLLRPDGLLICQA